MAVRDNLRSCGVSALTRLHGSLQYLVALSMKGKPKTSAASLRSSPNSTARKLPVGILCRWKNLRCSSLSCGTAALDLDC